MKKSLTLLLALLAGCMSGICLIAAMPVERTADFAETCGGTNTPPCVTCDLGGCPSGFIQAQQEIEQQKKCIEKDGIEPSHCGWTNVVVKYGYIFAGGYLVPWICATVDCCGATGINDESCEDGFDCT